MSKMKRNPAIRIVAMVLCLMTLASMIPVQADALNPTYTPSTYYQNGQFYQKLKNVQLTGDQRVDVVNIAKSQIGYHEGSSSKQLSGSYKGSDNYTEYGKWYGLQDMWCAMFVSWVTAQARVSTNVVPKTASTVSGLNFFRNSGRAYTRSQVANGVYTPQPGDIIYFKGSRNNSATNHVGIVTGYSNKTVYTIEGNTKSSSYSTNGGGVYEKSYKISDTYIVYICSPKYTNTSNNTNQNSGSGQNSGSYYPACSSGQTSIVNALKSIGVDFSYSFRKTIAQANGISSYSGTAAQNTQLLKLLKAGRLVKPGAQAPSVSYFPACSSSHTSIVNALKSIGVDSSYSYRCKIAEKNNIANYKGSASQNTQLLQLLKAGRLIKP